MKYDNELSDVITENIANKREESEPITAYSCI